MILPPEAHGLVQVLAFHFTSPTYQRASTLLVGAILTTGRRTVANVLRARRHLAPGHRTDYPRVRSRAPWSGLTLGCALARFRLDHVVPDGVVTRVGDDTVDGHPGPNVCGKARHRDPVRSSHSYTAWRYGHTWVVLAVLVPVPVAKRRWALPILIDLYRTPELDRAEKHPHKTPAQLMCRRLRLFLLRSPDRTFVFTGDSGYGTHEVARFCDRHRARRTPISPLHPDANLFAPPPPYSGQGRPRIKGARVPKPRQAAETASRTRLTVVWYGGGTRWVEARTGTGHGYKGGCGRVPLRGVFVRAATGAHRDEYLFTTDPALWADAVVGAYCGRWSIETTFQEARSALGLETTRGRRRSERERSRGRARPRSRSPTPCAPSAGGCGTRPFCHRPGTARPFRNSRTPSANCY
ncbi:IS701 family transposase [Gemmata massiliana]|nr:transposase [Gemmata massiliana]